MIRRIGFFAAAWFATSVVIFALIRLAGGNIAIIILGQSATPEAIAKLEADFGLDRPLPVQYFSWITGVLTGDLGQTFRTGTSVGSEILTRLTISLPLAVGAMVIAIAVAVTLGTYAAAKAGTPIGSLLAFVSQVGIAVPVFWAGVLLALVFGVQLGWLPTGGWVPWSDDVLGAIKSLVLPCLTLGVIEAASLSRYVRSAVLDVMNADYVRASRALGMRKREALLKVAVPNAAMPVVTVLGIQIASLIGGAIIVEQVFSLPGLSRMVLSMVNARELIAVQSIVLVIVTFVLAINLIVDLLYAVLDPRIRVAR